MRRHRLRDEFDANNLIIRNEKIYDFRSPPERMDDAGWMTPERMDDAGEDDAGEDDAGGMTPEG